ncbi:prolyl oligopeptidase family serine peptidase [Neisseria sp. Ec49-e6-T10]|uniref:prolyl oligopeptidase family serine peptidase n=1 Tax=Neisseria sp. Ec49-e6-T10 TaxID=3140744 RepID=UPI003EBBE612
MTDIFFDSKIEAQIAHAKTTIQDNLQTDKRFIEVQQGIVNYLRDDKNIAFCEEHNGKMYHFFQDERYPKGVYRVSLAPSYRAGIPDWQILFSVADFDAILAEDVYLTGVNHYTLNPSKVLLSLSPNGQDGAFTLEFDLSTGKIVENGFHFPLGKSQISWKDEDSVWVCPAWDQRQVTDAGYASEVWLLYRGQNFEEATPIFKTAQTNTMVDAWRYLDAQGSPIDLIEESLNFFHKKYHLITDEAQIIPLILPEHCEIVGFLYGQLIIHTHGIWQRNKQTYLSGSLLAVCLHKGVLGNAHLLFEPTQTQAIECIETTRHFIILHFLAQVKSQLKAWHWSDHIWHEHPLPSLPQGTLEIIDQPWGGNLLYLAYNDFLTPITLFALDLNHNEISIIRKAPKAFDASSFKTEQYFAQSKDGTSIPYFWIGSTATPQTPTLIYVYGGFNMPELPNYLGIFGQYWLQKGGSFVVANVRGGGEYGPDWHQAAQKTNKFKSIDDLLAVVDHLVDTKKSTPEKIALQGGSNGGLLVASAFVRSPEKMAAVVCENPLTDMLHYHKLAAGMSWIAEYGDPNNPEEYEALAELSPLHQLQSGIQYPPILLTTSLSDDRVHPSHAISFYCALKELGQQALLYIGENGGHTGNQTQEETAYESAIIFIFLYQSLNML